MSATLKINVALVAGLVAIAVSVGGVLIGVGGLLATQGTHRRDIDRNAVEISTLKVELSDDIDRVQDQMREDKAELLTAIINAGATQQ